MDNQVTKIEPLSIVNQEIILKRNIQMKILSVFRVFTLFEMGLIRKKTIDAKISKEITE